MHGLHSNGHRPLNVRIDQVVKKGDDYNHQEVIDAWHQVCEESGEPEDQYKYLEHIFCHILCIKGHTMFAAVFAATLFVLSAATGGSVTDSCTASLPPLVGGGGECSASGGGDLVSEVRQNVSTLLQGVYNLLNFKLTRFTVLYSQQYKEE